MKLATYRPKAAQAAHSAIGAVVGDALVDLNYAYARYLAEVDGELRAYPLADARIPRDMLGFLQGGERALDAARRTLAFVEALKANDRTGHAGERLAYALDEVTLLAPLARPSKILAAGKNYADHAAEGAAGKSVEARPFPVGFVKVASAVIGPDDPIELPHVTQQLDYEVELAVVIGRRGRYIPREKAYDYVAGYTILNDVSARDIQFAESKYGNHMIGKNMDGLSPMGPWIVTRDEMPDPMALEVAMLVNGEPRQKASTATMIHDIPALIERWSWGTLEPGDIIATGTPAGVALGGHFPYLKPGDVMECVVEGIGRLRNPVVAEAPRGPFRMEKAR